MKLLGKRFLRSVVAIAILAVLALLGINLYLRTPGGRRAVAGAVESRMGVGMTFRSISYLPWRGLAIGDLEMGHRPEIAALIGAPFFQAKAALAGISLWSLIDRPIQLGYVRLVQPKITTMQWHDGSVAFPWSEPSSAPMLAESALDSGPEVAGQPEAQGPGVEAAGESVSPSGAPGGIPRSTQRAPELAGSGMELGELVVSGGEVILLGPGGGRILVAVEGIECRVDLGVLDGAMGGYMERKLGEVAVARGELVGVMEAMGIHSEVHLQADGGLALPNIQASSDGGVIEGRVTGHPRKPGMPFQISLGCRDLSVASMARRASSSSVFSRGKVEGLLEAEGLLSTTRTWRGRGEMTMKEAALSGDGWLEALSGESGARPPGDVAIEDATLAFHVMGPAVWVDEIHWKTDNLEFKGLGTVGMNQRAKLRARLYFSERWREILQRIEDRSPGQIVREFGQLEGRDDYYRDFVISGPLNDLRANLIGSEGSTFEEMFEVIRLNAVDPAEKRG